ncbi:MAG: methylmalonyl Co-A mutase-associated GTPase MeaB [Candidatus Kapabacteria bacterium]|nr:methylmalonyl Co-A mutase-associated GTPase MeaB [Candidatus Kapabacteria bacterium]
MMRDENIEQLFDEVRTGSRRALARALSLVESTTPSDRESAFELLELCTTVKKTSRRVGLTGSPGVGKSTLVESLGLLLVESGSQVAVLAVDPSSKRSGGSILGDKVRMPRLSLHPHAFIRPSPSKLALGGAATTTRDSIAVCEAAGYDTVLVETVGVGQSEIEVASIVDLFLLLVLPTAGDDVQGIKRGIMEVAHAILVTKSDIDSQATNVAVATYSSALRLMMPSQEGWETPVLSVCATQNNGLDGVLEVMERFFDDGRRTHIDEARKLQRTEWFNLALQNELFSTLLQSTQGSEFMKLLKQQVIDNGLPPSVAVHRLVSHFIITIKERS